MRIYTVHLRSPATPTRRDDDLVLLPEGFNWPAALFSVLWALWNRLWWLALALLIVHAALDAALDIAGAGPWHRAVFAIALALAIGAFANDARRRLLGLRGFDIVGIVGARDRAAAEQRLFDLRPDLAEGLRP